jgi:DNA-binding XRE family transcriptional regulator
MLDLRCSMPAPTAEGRRLEHERTQSPRTSESGGDDRAGGRDPAVAVSPIFVISQSFPARPSSIPEIRDFVQRQLGDSPMSGHDAQEVRRAVLDALLNAASPEGGVIQVSFRFYPEGVEVDVLRAPVAGADAPLHDRPEDRPFAEWLAQMLRREGLSQEAAARQLGVSVKTVSRWVGGETEPRLRDLRRIREVFGEAPLR